MNKILTICLTCCAWLFLSALLILADARADIQVGAPALPNGGMAFMPPDPREELIPVEDAPPLTLCQFEAGVRVLHAAGTLDDVNRAIGRQGRLVKRYKQNSGTDLVREYAWDDRFGNIYHIRFNQYGQAIDGIFFIPIEPQECNDL